VVVRRGEVWWASLPEPEGSGPGFRRPVLVVQSNDINESRIGTVIVAVLTTNLRWADAPGNVLLTRRASGLPKDSAVNVTQLVAIDRSLLTERVSAVPSGTMLRIDDGLRLVLSL
jgi:mRNA interferase MazF